MVLPPILGTKLKNDIKRIFLCLGIRYIRVINLKTENDSISIMGLMKYVRLCGLIGQHKSNLNARLRYKMKIPFIFESDTKTEAT